MKHIAVWLIFMLLSTLLPVSAAGALVIHSVQVTEQGIVIGANQPIPKQPGILLLKFSNPNRMIIDVPDASLSLKETDVPINQFGIRKIELSESKNVFYNTSRITVYTDSARALSALNATLETSKVLITSQGGPPVAASPTPAPVPEKSTLENLTGKTLVQEIYFRDNRLWVRANGPLKVKNRMLLSDPSRLVVDIENTSVANRGLLQPIWINQAGLHTIRVGQFDENTVRLVIESDFPERLAIQNDHETVLTMTPGTTPAESGPNAVVSVPGLLNGIFLDEKEGRTVVRLAASVPMAQQVVKQGDRIIVTLQNLQAEPGPIRVDRSQFPHVASMRLEALGGHQSRLIIQLRNDDTQMASDLLSDGRQLQLVLFGSARDNTEDRPTEVVKRLPFNATVVIDAGHGGKDQGASRAGILEKDLNLRVALKVKAALEARGIKTHMTRSSDVFLPLPEITRITNSIRPDVFVSVHTNSSTNPGITGIETYYFTPQSVPLARKIHQKMVSNIASPDRGVRQARFYVIHHTPVPAVLCEMGYISNAGERNSLASEWRQQKTANAIADGVVDYLKSRLSAQAKTKKAS
jgi:N-acetylmuramoyl-L-alanine amidase